MTTTMASAADRRDSAVVIELSELVTPRAGYYRHDDDDGDDNDDVEDDDEEEEEEECLLGGTGIHHDAAPLPPRPPPPPPSSSSLSSSSTHRLLSSSSCLLSRKSLGYYGDDRGGGIGDGDGDDDDDDDCEDEGDDYDGGGGIRDADRRHIQKQEQNQKRRMRGHHDTPVQSNRTIKAPSHFPDSPHPDTTAAMDGGGGAGNDNIDSEAASSAEHHQQRERRRHQQQQNPLQPILSSLLLSSIREEEGEDNNDDDDDDDDPDDPNRHHRVMHAVVDTTMQVMDYIEDEIDTNTWNKLDDFVPMQLRLAIEDQVFGWDHFLSSILGHVGYTMGSYLATYWLVTFVVLRQVPWGGQQRGDVDRGDHAADDLRPWGMPYELFAFLRAALSIGSAISTFRTIRRRRRVWLPVRRAPSSSSSSSSSAADSADAAASNDLRSTFREADRLSRRCVLGAELWNKMRRSYAKRRDRVLARSVRRRLERAESLFEERRRRMHGGGGDDGGGGGMMRSISASSLLSLLSNDEDDDDVVDGDVVHRRRGRGRRAFSSRPQSDEGGSVPNAGQSHPAELCDGVGLSRSDAFRLRRDQEGSIRPWREFVFFLSSRSDLLCVVIHNLTKQPARPATNGRTGILRRGALYAHESTLDRDPA